MLKALNTDQAHFIALLAQTARMQRDKVLCNVAEDDLAEVKAARGEHNPTAELGFVPLPPKAAQITALRDAIAGLSSAERSELYALTRLGQGDLAVQHWHRGVTEAATLGDEIVMAYLIEDPDLHYHLTKGLYEAKLAS